MEAAVLYVMAWDIGSREGSSCRYMYTPTLLYMWTYGPDGWLERNGRECWLRAWMPTCQTGPPQTTASPLVFVSRQDVIPRFETNKAMAQRRRSLPISTQATQRGQVRGTAGPTGDTRTQGVQADGCNVALAVGDNDAGIDGRALSARLDGHGAAVNAARAMGTTYAVCAQARLQAGGGCGFDGDDARCLLRFVWVLLWSVSLSMVE